MTSAGQVTQLLKSWSQGDQEALGRLMPVVYGELRRLARRQMARERPDHTLQVTALVHEAYLRLLDVRQVDWQDRAHFLALSAQMMRRILVDAARARTAGKRGGGVLHVSLEEAAVLPADPDRSLIALDEALAAFAAIAPRQANVVELRYFGGLTEEEIAAVLDQSARTVRRDWEFARVWLARELAHDPGQPS